MIGEVRRLIYGLRPPALDELGLVDSLRGIASRETSSATTRRCGGARGAAAASRSRRGRRLPHRARGADQRRTARPRTILHRPPLHPAGRPARRDRRRRARHRATAAIGVGLRTMQERAAELGGSCEITSTPGAGTIVAARLPRYAPERGRRLSEPIRILIADDHPLFRAGLRSLLESVAGHRGRRRGDDRPGGRRADAHAHPGRRRDGPQHARPERDRGDAPDRPRDDRTSTSS